MADLSVKQLAIEVEHRLTGWYSSLKMQVLEKNADAWYQSKKKHVA